MLAGAHLHLYAVPGCGSRGAEYDELGCASFRLCCWVLDNLLHHEREKELRLAEGETEERPAVKYVTARTRTRTRALRSTYAAGQRAHKDVIT